MRTKDNYGMARPFNTAGAVDRARQVISATNNASELRAAQAVLLATMGLSNEQIGQAIGRTPVWTSRLRRQFVEGRETFAHQDGRGGRRRQHFTAEVELALVRKALEGAYRYSTQPYRSTLREILRELVEDRLGEQPAESTLTGMLNRAALKWLGDKSPRLLDLKRRELLDRWREQAKSQ